MAEPTNDYVLTVGMEVHAELKTRSKMFCACTNDPDAAKPNTNVCPVCMGHPGTLPVPNRQAIEAVVRVGIALGCDIAEESSFDRKNYFYPDLPKAYQITQFERPLCQKGQLVIPATGEAIRIKEIHLEEDTGKLTHPTGADYSLVDYNRAGVPLMELVTEPDVKSAGDAKAFCEELQLALRYLGVSDADMERGHMRCEANISIAKAGAKTLGTKVEVKNLNSFKAVERAILYEVTRQAEVLDAGERVVQETRGWDDTKGETYSQRSKESAHDYRYFPEPDIPPFTIAHGEALPEADGVSPRVSVENLRAHVPEMPWERRARFARDYGLPADQVNLFTSDRSLGEYFENVASELAAEAGSQAPQALKAAANTLINELPRALAEAQSDMGRLTVTPENFAEFALHLAKGTVSSAGAKTLLLEMVRTGEDPDHIIAEKNLAQVSDEGALLEAAQKVIDANPKVVADFKGGATNALQFLVGQVMKETKGKANPKVVQDLLRERLGA